MEMKEKKGKSKEHDTHSIQEAFSHSTSCITHEVLTEQSTHSPFPLAVFDWQPEQVVLAFLSLFLSLSLFLLLQALAPLPQARGYDDRRGRGCWRKGRWPGLQPRPVLEPSWVALLVPLVKLAVCSVHTAPEQCITVGPVFRQSDRSQPEHPKNRGIEHSTHTSPPANIYILSLHLSFFCCWFSVSSSFPTWNLCSDFPLCLSPPSFSPSPPSTLLSLILSCFSLCLSPPLLLRFNKSPGGRREKTGGVKTSMALFTKGPGIARR